MSRVLASIGNCSWIGFTLATACTPAVGTSTSSSGSSAGGGTTTSAATTSGTTSTATSSTGAGGCTLPTDCASGICQAGVCADNLLGAFAWPGSKYDQRIARLSLPAAFASAGGLSFLDYQGHGLTYTAISPNQTTLGQQDFGAANSQQSALITAVSMLSGNELVADLRQGAALDLASTVNIPATSNGNYQLVITRLAVSGGAEWATVIGGVFPQSNTIDRAFIADITTDGAGYVWVLVNPNVNTQATPFVVNGTTIPSPTQYANPILLKLNPANGQLVLSHWLSQMSCGFASLPDGTKGYQPSHVLVGTDSGVVVTGIAEGRCDFGGGQIPAQPVAFSFGYVADFDSNANHVWSRAFVGMNGGTATTGLESPAIARFGTGLYVAGEISGSASIDFGTGPLKGAVAVARLDLASGTTEWAKGFPGSGYVSALSASTGGVTIAGSEDSGGLDFTVKDTGPGVGPFLAKLDPTGTPLWKRTFAAAANVRGLDSTGGENVALYLSGTGVDFGSGPLTDSPSKLSVGQFQLP